jgi:hypothetical protein
MEIIATQAQMVILNHLLVVVALVGRLIPHRQLSMEAVVAGVLLVQAQVTIQDPPSVKEVMRNAISQAIPPVRLSVPKLERALLEPVVLLVIARRFVMHITLQQ